MPRSSLQGDDMSLLSETWSGVYSAFRGNEFIMLTLGEMRQWSMQDHSQLAASISGSVFVIFGVFVLSNVPFGLLDLTGWPPSLLKYKIQEEKPVPVRIEPEMCMF